ncbi:hypothetical protein GUITHDRAFT_109114 [Guillardia theta CCMP2712]|uniref:Uncharacterized protein n=1 Tax=Guillardia theta (strain CCMP2712) TaxID=905079 RepID=L1JAE8_GUITC|nr:hypothetical protein GUITHDRAFT_109114 [Guillardia theta CCMP2712]EKX45070.1 hypothetical protein GUITHDRAFT_109114 [Guillardia theta CCMP2712]|eukprot:XP_005832050.1 hypothetical protein GUITHDRAFT_109114 [Guillardia theta CCMP2712]
MGFWNFGGAGHVALALVCLSLFSSTMEEAAGFNSELAVSTMTRLRMTMVRLNLRGGGKKFKGKMFPSAMEKRIKPLTDRSDFQVDNGEGRKVPTKMEKDWQVMRWLNDDPLEHPTLQQEYEGIDRRSSLHPANQMIIMKREEKLRKKLARRQKGLKRRMKILKMMKMQERKQKRFNEQQMASTNAATGSTKTTSQPNQPDKSWKADMSSGGDDEDMYDVLVLAEDQATPILNVSLSRKMAKTFKKHAGDKTKLPTEAGYFGSSKLKSTNRVYFRRSRSAPPPMKVYRRYETSNGSVLELGMSNLLCRSAKLSWLILDFLLLKFERLGYYHRHNNFTAVACLCDSIVCTKGGRQYISPWFDACGLASIKDIERRNLRIQNISKQFPSLTPGQSLQMNEYLLYTVEKQEKIPLKNMIKLCEKTNNFRQTGGYADSALRFAVQRDCHLSLATLCQAGFKASNREGPLLHLAARLGHPKCVEVLLSQGKMKLDAKNLEGNTPLHAAAAAGKFEMVKRLCEMGANAFIPNNNNLTAADVSVMDNKDANGKEVLVTYKLRINSWLKSYMKKRLLSSNNKAEHRMAIKSGLNL